MAFQEQDNQLILDGLLCEEECIEEKQEINEVFHNFYVKKEPSFSVCSLFEHDLFWEDDELFNLMAKEKDAQFGFNDMESVMCNGSVMVARYEAVEWILKVKAHYGFTGLTCVLALNYFDRFVLSLKFPEDKPWMGQLAAVACLSLAAKVEETQVPLLLDLQVEEAKYVFEAKTIKRMELLVLSALQWRMNPVTPIAFFDHIIRRFGLKNHLHLEFLRRCERLLLHVISDSRFMCYLPSALATAIMLHVIKEVEPCNEGEYQNQLMSVIQIDEDKVNECYKLILELPGNEIPSYKRKYPSAPGSPNGVIDAYFSCDSSNDSWNVSSSVSSSPLPQFKRSRIQDQQMRLPSLHRTFVDVLTSPR
ncbi:cyclin-D3-3 isoform X2 [Mercurialis annua]|uniref:cyclin-D3-3 isoform X1 n=1 Tax=Mercurialis annua TaxID=3986 RepID=UPI0021609495|nr:cyclin-D3-3 isoform X1 [Mercurialis annua]XP_050208194.1 cyclin-D3-3 isoform X2 [Mercurialis annua]